MLPLAEDRNPPDAISFRGYIWLFCIIAIGAAFTLLRQRMGHGNYLLDLRAFYCGGNAVLHHLDPYSTSTAACQHSLAKGSVSLRAPHPPFALVIYAVLALLPYKSVAYVYIIAAWLAVGLTAAILSKLSQIGPGVVALGISPLLGYYCISLGQPTPFIALFIVAAALLLLRERVQLAAIVAVLTLIYPQFGLPMIAAMFVCVPRARVALVSSTAALGLVGLIFLGPAAHVQYVSNTLRLEQLQTQFDGTQYSVTWFLEQLHVPEYIASTVMSLCYVVVIGLGIYLLRQRAVLPRTRALVALLPPALVALSSSFVHLQHVALALPLALFSLSLKPKANWTITLGTALVIIPWRDCIVGTLAVHDLVRVMIFFALGIAFLVLAVAPRTLDRRSAWLVPIVVGCYAVTTLIIHLALRGYAGADATVPNTLSTLSFKLPSILGLLAVVAYTAKVLWASRPSQLPA